jgi:hypothetical protein
VDKASGQCCQHVGDTGTVVAWVCDCNDAEPWHVHVVGTVNTGTALGHLVLGRFKAALDYNGQVGRPIEALF